MRDKPINKNIAVATIHIATCTRFDLIRAVRIAASAPKKTALVSECPLGKLYVSGGKRLKNGTGRGRLNASLRVIFNKPAPIIVSAKSFASRFHFCIAKRTTTKIVPRLSAIVEPANENPRMIAVMGGEAS